MAQQADAVFILTGWWGVLREMKGEMPEWPAANRQKWEDYVQKATELHKKENARRLARGEPPQVIGNNYHLMQTYYPEKHVAFCQPEPIWYFYTGKDYAEALHILRKESASKLSAKKSGITKRTSDRFSLNAVFFAEKAGIWEPEEENFKRLTSLCKGRFRVISGLEAIQKSVSTPEN